MNKSLIYSLFILSVIFSASHGYQYQPISRQKRTNPMPRYQSINAPQSEIDNSLSISSQVNGDGNFLGLGNFETNAKRRFLMSLINGYPYAPVDSPNVPENYYYITDWATGTVIEPFRPSMFTFSYPFDIPAGWDVYDPIDLGVNPPVFPNDDRYSYKGYWYGCPPFVDLRDPLYWAPGPNLFTNFCAYSYY